MLELALGIIAVFLFAVIEGYYIHTGRATISQHIRDAYLRYPPFALLVGLVVGLLLGHFFWFI